VGVEWVRGCGEWWTLGRTGMRGGGGDKESEGRR